MRRRIGQAGLLLAATFILAACHPIFHQADGECDFIDEEKQAAAVALFPWLANGTSLDGQGPFYGSATIQNLEPEDIEVDILVGSGTSSDNWVIVETIELSGFESQSLSAAALGIEEGSGASVVALGYLSRGEWDDDDESCDEPAEYAAIAGVAKHVSPVEGGNPTTTANNVTVDGYSAMRLDQVMTDLDEPGHDGGESNYVLPVVQTNSGWDTTIRVANFDPDGTSLTNVSVTLYGSGGQGFAGVSQVINLQIRPGGVESIVLSDYVPDEWVGSAVITSGANIGAVAERHKAETDMLITNFSRPETEPAATELYGPLVFKEYNFWNTGIAVANTSPERSNSVTITYYGPTMNEVGQDTLTIPPRGMEFVYTPGNQDLGLSSGFVGSAIITGTETFHAVVDQVKYFGDDPDVGQAMSYSAEPYPAFDGDRLAMPLVQKGNSQSGSGDTSGMQLFNTSADESVDLEIVFYGANGLPVAPTVENNDPDPIVVSLAAHQSYTLYTHQLTELSSGFRGSLVVDVVGGDGGVVGVSNNVNYDVQGDGSAAFNLVGIPDFDIPDIPDFPPILPDPCELVPQICEE